MTIKENLKIEPDTEEELESVQDTPKYIQKITLKDEKRKKLTEEIKVRYDILKVKRSDFKLEAIWDDLDNAYAGIVDKLPGQQFDVTTGLLKDKVDKAVNKTLESVFFDPLFSITALPEYEEEGGQDVCDHQSDFLDYKLDEVVKIRLPMELCAHSSYLKGNSWLFVTSKIETEPRRDRKKFKGNPLYRLQDGSALSPDQAKQVKAQNPEVPMQYENEGLKNFIEQFPDAAKDYKSYIKKLHEGEEIKVVVTYDEVTYNDPMFEYINLKDLYIDPAVESIHDISRTELISHRKNYSYWKLKKLEERGEFQYVDDLLYKWDKEGKKGEKIEGAENKDYDIMRHTYYAKIDGDKEEKCVFWISEKEQIMIGAERYRHDRLRTEYLPFFVKKKRAGIYQDGIGEDLIDNANTVDLMLNFLLQAMYLSSMITPNCKKGSSTERQFAEHEFVIGAAITWDEMDTPDFLQNHMPRPDVAGILNTLNYIYKWSGEKVNVTSALSGQADPLDPRAPASKHLAQITTSDFNFKSYISLFAGSFSEIGYACLAIYHQMSQDGEKYRVRPERVVQGDNPFNEITRDEMVARTNIQSQASAFDFDKRREKQDNVALYSLLRPEMKTPEEVNTLLRFIVKSWNQSWKHNVDQVMPTLEETQQRQLMVAMQAVDKYVKVKAQEAQTTQIPMKFDPNELMATIQQATQDLANPPDEKEVKRREKEGQ